MEEGFHEYRQSVRWRAPLRFVGAGRGGGPLDARGRGIRHADNRRRRADRTGCTPDIRRRRAIGQPAATSRLRGLGKSRLMTDSPFGPWGWWRAEKSNRRHDVQDRLDAAPRAVGTVEQARPTCTARVGEIGTRWVPRRAWASEESVGPARCSRPAGSRGRIVNAVTDIDYSGTRARKGLRLDPDDSFRSSSTSRMVIGGGSKTPCPMLDAAAGRPRTWTSGRRTTSTAPPTTPAEGPPEPCRYDIENRLGIVRRRRRTFGR